jgi:hypothetical protein
VTLDDGQIAPLGAAPGTRRLVRAAEGLSAAVVRLYRLVSASMAPVAAAAIAVLLVKYRQSGKWDTALLAAMLPHGDGLLRVIPRPPQPVGVNLATLFYLLVMAELILLVVLLAFLVAMLATILLAGLSLLAFSGIRSVDRLNTRSRARINGMASLSRATAAVVAGSRKVLAPRLVVLSVADGWWQESVETFAEISAATVVDVSEPSENVLWEVQRLREARTRFIPIGHVDELPAVLDGADPTGAQDPCAGRLRELLDGEEVLGYNLTRSGRRRFARALRGSLLCRSGNVPVAMPPQSLTRPEGGRHGTDTARYAGRHGRSGW